MRTASTLTAAMLSTLALAACGSGSHSSRSATTPHAVVPVHRAKVALPVVRIGIGRPGRAIPRGFVGLSFEYTDLETYAGTNPNAIDPVFAQLVRNLAPGGDPVLRIGGVTTDHTWSAVPSVTPPPWVQFTLTPGWIAVARAVATKLSAKLILGINFEADSSAIATGEADALIAGIGADHIAGLELGNEPELWGSFPWYRTAADVHVRGRVKAEWTPEAMAEQFREIADALPTTVPVAGPAVGSPKWTATVGAFLADNPEDKLVTIHAYPLKRCRATTHVTAAELLAQASTDGLGVRVAAAVAAAHAAGDLLRVGEMNSISCGGEPGVSDSFASALWIVDALFALARTGVDGVNLHSTPTVSNHLFTFTHAASGWVGQVYPIYYGIALFNQAAPAGSRLLPVDSALGPAVREWATRDAGGTVRVVLINTGTSGQTVAVRLRGLTHSGTVERLLDPGGLGALTGVTLGGQSFGTQTTTGLLQGTVQTTTVPRRHRRYAVTLPAQSALLLTVP